MPHSTFPVQSRIHLFLNSIQIDLNTFIDYQQQRIKQQVITDPDSFKLTQETLKFCKNLKSDIDFVKTLNLTNK